MAETHVPMVMRSPRHVDIELTARCNQRCRYCYFFDNPDMQYRDLATDEWLTFFDELGALGVMKVTLAGGEPFIRKDLPELIESLVRNGMRYTLLSNGGLITDQLATFIRDTGRNDAVQVSIDGSRSETHDACRGDGSFEGAMRGLRTLQRNGVRAAVRVTLHRYNVDDLENIAHLLLDELGLPGFGTNSAGYLGTCRQNADDVMLTTEERQRAMETLLRLNEKYGGRISALAGPLAEGRHWRRMEEARIAHAPPFPRGGRLTACGCPTTKMAVRADGAMVPCNIMNHLVIGWINQDSLAEVWLHSPGLQALRSRWQIPLTDFEFCAGCEYIPYCTGNCPGLAYTLTGELNHPSPDACLRQFLRDGGQIP